MGRPAKFDRNAAIQTVMNQIWRDGYEASSVKALSESLGITRSSFYNAFGTREALFEEVMAAYNAQSPDRAFGEGSAALTLQQLFTQTFYAAVEARTQDKDARGCLLINTVTEQCGPGGELGELLTDVMIKNRQLLTSLIMEGQERGEMPKDKDPQALGLAVQSLLVGLNVMSKVIRDQAQLWQAAKAGLKGLGLYDDEFSDQGNEVR